MTLAGYHLLHCNALSVRHFQLLPVLIPRMLLYIWIAYRRDKLEACYATGHRACTSGSVGS